VEIWPGAPLPLGVTCDDEGANVAVYSAQAEAVELCLFDEDGAETRVELPEVHGFVWHGYVPGLRPGARYGFRAHGRFEPARGLFLNPAKLLLDPYARAVDGELTLHPALYPHDPYHQHRPNTADSAPFVPKSVVAPQAERRDRRGRTKPVPMADSVIYEVHVKGATMRHPGVPEHLRGTYAGFAHEAWLDHLVELGVTAVELLPVQQFVHEPFLLQRGLSNYWGYQPIAYFAPHGAYSSSGTRGQQVDEFRSMVAACHERGLEVIVDVVYNHTGEGGPDGPSLCFRGLDNSYYHLDPADRARYIDFTGCGNSLNVTNPMVLQLVMDSLRYWVTDLGVDGFRFDLASVLARETGGAVDHFAAFFDLVHQDPVINHVKLIAEPWDVGDGGYQVGNFPVKWAEWNGRYRDAVRDWWRGAGTVADFAMNLAGSSDLYGDDGRRPFASVNFITAHDGFTIADLTAYERKHNEANGDDNRDGTDDNRSTNGGVEGPTDDIAVIAARHRRQRALLATLLLSQGVPMMLGGDEIGRTQSGNNNAYCQDNEISWFDWTGADTTLHAFVQALVRLRKGEPVLRRRRFLTGLPAFQGGEPDVAWFRFDGGRMADSDWVNGWARSLAMFLNGDAITERGPRGEVIRGNSFYLCINGWTEGLTFTIPAAVDGKEWNVEIDTARWPSIGVEGPLAAGSAVPVEPMSMVLLRREPHDPG
jgi:isoamylase